MDVFGDVFLGGVGRVPEDELRSCKNVSCVVRRRGCWSGFAQSEGLRLELKHQARMHGEFYGLIEAVL
jgi:hypothetical protein